MPGTRCRRWLARPGRLGALAAACALLAACDTHPAPPLSVAGLAAARAFREYTVYWAGPSVGGTPLTAADPPTDFYAPVGFTMYYGDCEGRGQLHDGGCLFPLKIATSIYSQRSDPSEYPLRRLHLHGVPAVQYNHGRSIEVYTDRMGVVITADTATRAMLAAKALTVFNRRFGAADPAFPAPFFTPHPGSTPPTEATGPSGASGASGASGVTGATSDIGPPSTLQPAAS